MAAIVDYVEDIEFNVSSNGSEIVREKGISAKSFSEIVSGNLIPGYGTRHPEYSAFRLISGAISRTGNDGGKWQGWWRGTYSNQSSSGSVTPVDKDPWDMDAQNYTVEPFPIEVPMEWGWDRNGDYHQLRNTAGCMLQRTRTIYGSSHKFIYCVKSKVPAFENHAIVNSASCKIAGTTFEAYTAMLMPPSSAFRVDYNDDGTVKRSYWEISVEIRVHPVSWETETLNVGTMARFKNEKGELNSTPEQIYKYYPWDNNESSKDFEKKPVFGSIRDVVKAKHNYAVKKTGVTHQSDQYYQAYAALPWEEVTEPMPLNLNGEVYTEALEDPESNEYYVVALFDTPLGKLSQFGFPKRKED